MKLLHHFPITLTLQGPILTKSTAPSSFGLDAAVARDFISQKPSLPGSLIKGKLREAFVQLGLPVNLDTLFGKDTERDSGNEPERGNLFGGDFIATTPEQTNPSRNFRIAVDSERGSVQHQMLRAIETPYLAGEEVTFVGSFSSYLDAVEARILKQQLETALNWLTQIGSLRTTGFGRLLSVSVGDPASVPSVGLFTSSPVALEIEIAPRGPLCISKPKIGDNLFESEDIIPGNMFAGAVQQTAKAIGVTIPDFDSIRFRHAFPTAGASRPVALPLSTVKTGNTPSDIAFHREPVCVKNADGEFVAPAFPLDWKEDGDVKHLLGWATPARELRVRTKIDSTKRTADKGVDNASGSLFAWEMVHPWTNPDQATQVRTPIKWRTCIDFSAVSDPSATASALAQVLGQLGFLSKTKATCAVAVTPVNQSATADSWTTGQTVALVLQTPALLADPRFQALPGVPTSGAIEAEHMLACYAAVWSELSDSSLKLSHHFAQQTLVGGNHLALRFQKGKPYDPWLLTTSGSVFVFTVSDAAKANEKLAAWLRSGLSLPQWAVNRYGDRWNSHPYIPQNGFGEVAVHAPVFASPEVRPAILAQPILPNLV